MAEQSNISRREFTVAAALAALSGVAITITACGGGSDSPSSPSTPPPTAGGGGSGDKSGAISSNHGHTATITAAQLTAAAEVALDIRGASDHPHTVALSAAEVASIAGGQRISKESSTDAAHSHTVTFN